MPVLHETEAEAMASRLRHSRNLAERQSIYAGKTYDYHQPVLIDLELMLEHMHVVGPTGTGKTTRALITQSLQMIAQNQGPLVIIDMKGDPAFFHAVRDRLREVRANIQVVHEQAGPQHVRFQPLATEEPSFIVAAPIGRTGQSVTQPATRPRLWPRMVLDARLHPNPSGD